jgi:hypothetical protein
MKTPKELDILRRAALFDDTPEIIDDMKLTGFPEWAKHLHKLHIYHKGLIAEIRKLRREVKKNV